MDVLIKEAEAGYIIPVEQPPAYLITMFCAQKKPKKGQTVAWRVVRNCSWKAEGMTCINEWIDPNHCTMKDLPYPLPTVRVYGQEFHGAELFATRDLKDAFRQILMRFSDAQRMGYSAFGKFFRDDRQPYGMASAAANCQHFGGIVIWIFEQQLPERLRGHTTLHIDDFTFFAKTIEDLKLMITTFDRILIELGIRQSPSKAMNGGHEGKVHGILWNTKNQTAGIPQDKREELVMTISTLLFHRMATKRVIESVAGKLMHWAQLNKASKSLCYNTIHWIMRAVRHPRIKGTEWFILPMRVINDLKYWLRYLQQIETVPIAHIIGIRNVTVYAATDASDTHGGVWAGPKWFNYKFTEEHTTDWHITLKEAHALLMLLHNLRHDLTGKTVVVYVDNQAVYHSVRRKWSSTHSVMLFIYEICLMMMEYKIDLWVEWIRSHVNVGADALSREDIPRFREYAGPMVDDHQHPNEYVSKFKMPIQLTATESEEHELKRFRKNGWGKQGGRWWLTKYEKAAIRRHLKPLEGDMFTQRSLHVHRE